MSSLRHSLSMCYTHRAVLSPTCERLGDIEMEMGIAQDYIVNLSAKVYLVQQVVLYITSNLTFPSFD